jgi:hypothetical protein
MKIKGIMARSISFSAVNCEASLVKTATVVSIERATGAGDLLRHGVKSITFRLARNFCDSASNMPCRATIYPGRLTQTTSNTASKTRRVR